MSVTKPPNKTKVILIRASDEIHARLDYIRSIYALNRQQAICRLISDTYNDLQEKKLNEYTHAQMETLPSDIE